MLLRGVISRFVLTIGKIFPLLKNYQLHFHLKQFHTKTPLCSKLNTRG